MFGGCAAEEGVDNSVVVAVGRRSSSNGGAVYSTMAGGECDGWKDLCSWKQLGGGPARTARTECFLRTLDAMHIAAIADVGAREEAAARAVDRAFTACMGS